MRIESYVVFSWMKSPCTSWHSTNFECNCQIMDDIWIYIFELVDMWFHHSNIILLNNLGPLNITVGCWELHLNVSFHVQLFEHLTIVLWRTHKMRAKRWVMLWMMLSIYLYLKFGRRIIKKEKIVVGPPHPKPSLEGGTNWKKGGESMLCKASKPL